MNIEWNRGQTKLIAVVDMGADRIVICTVFQIATDEHKPSWVGTVSYNGRSQSERHATEADAKSWCESRVNELAR